MDEAECWRRVGDESRGVLATVHAARGVDAVPIVYALLPDLRIVLPVDTVKRKRSTRLQRVANLEADSRCVLLVEHYDDDWSQLWWVRIHADGRPAPLAGAAGAVLALRFAQYRAPGSLAGALILTPTAVTGWRAE